LKFAALLKGDSQFCGSPFCGELKRLLAGFRKSITLPPVPINPFRTFFARLLVLAAGFCVHASGGEVYFTDFENFPVGDDKISGTDSWVATNNGQALHGIMDEALHGVIGIGNAAFIGGYATTSSTSTSKIVHVRRPLNLDPVALNQEIVTFSVVFGIVDSSNISLISGSNPPRFKRDNFEILIYNGDTNPQPLAGLQFDNTTLDSTSGLPRRLIFRLATNVTTGLLEYVSTSFSFLPKSLETLTFRINYRTNRWTATLAGVQIFQDLPFYGGTANKTLGDIRARMVVTNSAPVTNSILPGDNYMLFDDYTVRTDAVTTTSVVSKAVTGPAQLTWNEEAGYTFQVQYSSDLITWKTDLVGSTRTAATTESVTFTDPTIPVPTSRCYRLKCSCP
jgi:hypothetical protein